MADYTSIFSWKDEALPENQSAKAAKDFVKLLVKRVATVVTQVCGRGSAFRTTARQVIAL